MRTLSEAGMRWSSALRASLRDRLPGGLTRIELRSGASLAMPKENGLFDIFQEVWVEQRYLPPGLVVEDGGTIVDIGANGGVFAIWAAQRFPASRIVAVEPAAEAHEWLCRNLLASGAKNVVTANLACAGTSGPVTLYRRGPHYLNTLYRRDVYGSEFRTLATVQALSLDDLFARFGVDACGLLKLDCEGAEYDILMDASASTLRCIAAIALEYHLGMTGHTPAELARFLRGEGFCVTVDEPLDEENGYLYATRPSPTVTPAAPSEKLD